MPGRRTFVYCKDVDGHVIGEIVHRQRADEQVPALYVYDQSMAESPVGLGMPRKRFVAIGEVVGIECTICGRERDWTISNRSAVAMMIGLLNTLYEPARRKDQVTR